MSDFAARDFPEIYQTLGIDTQNLGCIMLDTEPIHPEFVPPAEFGFTDERAPYTKGFEAAATPHATILYGLLSKGQEVSEQVDEVLADWQAPEFLVAEYIEFFGTPDSVKHNPLVLRLDDASNAALLEAHNRVSLLPHIDTFPGFKSHITIGYVDKAHTQDVKDFYAKTYIDFPLRLKVTELNYGD